MSVRETSFHMAVLGDSIAWGSGLPDEAKFWMLVGCWLERRLGRPVNPHTLDLPSFPALPSTHLPPFWVVHSRRPRRECEQGLIWQ